MSRSTAHAAAPSPPHVVSSSDGELRHASSHTHSGHTGGIRTQMPDGTVSCSQRIATEIANDEINHVRFLRLALGSAAAKMPKINM